MADSNVTTKLSKTVETDVSSPKEVTFTQEELQSLGNLQSSYQEKVALLGQLRVQRLVLNQQMESLDTAEENAENEYVAVQQSENELVQTLNGKYGPGSLDPNTGVFTPSD